MLLRDRSARIWSDEDLRQIIEAVCIEQSLDLERPKHHQRLLWAATAWAIDWMLEDPPTHLPPLHLSRYRVLLDNAALQIGL